MLTASVSFFLSAQTRMLDSSFFELQRIVGRFVDRARGSWNTCWFNVFGLVHVSLVVRTCLAATRRIVKLFGQGATRSR